MCRMIEVENKWTIAEETLKQAFDKMEIDNKYYPVFVERATQAVNDIALAFEPEKDDIVASLDIATKFMNIFIGQIDAGLSETWAESYAYHRLDEDADYSAWEAFFAVHKSRGYEQAKNELVHFARFLDDDPIFVESYANFFIYKWTIEDVKEFIRIKKSLMEKGKSEVYAREYALHHHSTPDDDYCHLCASKFEECINKGIGTDKAYKIAEAYENLYEEYWPEDDNLLGIEGHNGYIKGFEYAIDNDIDSPESFAEEYEKAYLHSLFPDEEEPPCKIKGKYDDIISRLLANKV